MSDIQSNRSNEDALSLEDILSKAMWVSNVLDPSLCIDDLSTIFQQVIFSFPSPDKFHSAEIGQGPVVRTAAEKKKELKRRREMLDELRDLTTNTLEEGEEEHRSLWEEEEESEDENFEDEMENEVHMADQDFLNWIQMGRMDERDTTRHEDSKSKERKDVELELHRVGLGADQEAIADDTMPDRFREIAEKEGRTKLGSKVLPGGYTYHLPLESEAYWILRQLRNAGQPLAHNTRICALASHPLSSIVDDPVLVALCYALQKMTQEYLEPGYLMMYHQTPLHPLLFALFEDSNLQKAAEHTIPMTSYAYSTLTGARQRPYFSENDIGFHTKSKRSIGPKDPSWRHIQERRDYTQRKPCFIELGRLLVRILQLDILCHQLEYRRRQMLLMLEDSTEGHVQNQRIILENTVFESVVDADIWHSFVQTLVSKGPSRSAYRRVQELGLQEAFEEYSLTGLQYQENLLQGKAIALCPRPRMHLMEWADHVAKSLSQPATPEYVISLFNKAIVEQFSKLPVFCRQVMDYFCSMGHLIVSYNSVKKMDDVYPLSTFFVEHPKHYLELLQLKEQRRVDLHYVLDEALVRQVLRENELYHIRPSGTPLTADIEEEWYMERQAAINGVIVQVVENLVPRVKAELSQQARYHSTCLSIEWLSTYCSMGPYQRTKLVLSAFLDNALLWEPSWNVVEALPTEEFNTSRILHRVCGVFQGDNGFINFSFIDEMGTLITTLRWSEPTSNMRFGNSAGASDQAKLLRLFETCNPSVVAVAATSPESLSVMVRIQRFLNDYVYPSLHVRIPVIWAADDTARFFSESRFVDIEMPSVDTAIRRSVGIARFVQDPLQVITALFDSKKTVLHFLCNPSQYTTRDQQDELYRALCWEVSLWVASTGFWAEDCERRPNSVAILQFVPGLGISKAVRLHQQMNDHPPMDRLSLKLSIEENFSLPVATNASPCIRIAAPQHSIEGLETIWHPLDQTLIPHELYEVSTYVAAVCTKMEKNRNSSLLSLNLIDFLNSKRVSRREAVHLEVGDGRDVFSDMKKLRSSGFDKIYGNREVEFIADELVSYGASFMRRNFRRMTTKSLLLCIGGIAYFSSAEYGVGYPSASSSMLSFALQSSSIFQKMEGGACDAVREGDRLSGTIDGFRIRKLPGIRITTSKGLRAFMPVNEVESEAHREELIHHLHHLEEMGKNPEKAKDSSTGIYTPPDWLQRGAVIQGIVFHCHWSTCELLLRWCPPETIDLDLSSTDTNYVSYSDIIKDGTSSLNSIRTSQIEEDANTFASKLSKHPFFRDVSKTEAMDLLRDKEIGEVLFRPSSRQKVKSICMVKLGTMAIANLIISEDRRPDGSIFYYFEDKISQEGPREFSDVDEFLQSYINPMVQRVLNLREHRRFIESISEVRLALEDQQEGTLRFGYVFVENTKNSRPPLYRVYTRGGGKEHRFDLHINDHFIFVRLPFFLMSVDRKLRSAPEYKWVECSSAENLSETLKSHAIQSSM